MTTVAAPSSDSDAPPIPQPVGRARDDTRLALLFLLPALIGFVVFLIWPTLRGIYLSFTEFNLLTPPRFNGLDNYVRMVQDPIFWNAMGVTLYYVAINIGLQTVLALVIAVMMQRLTQKTWLRGIVLTPYLVSNVVAAMVFLWILDYQLGFANQVLAALGLDRIAFFTSDALVIPTVAAVNVWRHVGYTALLIFAGLQTIPVTVYEAGKMDGASEMRMFRSITIPLLRPILALVLIITVVARSRCSTPSPSPPRVARWTPRACCSSTSTTSPSGASSSATPRRCRWRCC
jgi:multiple sugar transport system permease protein